MKPKRINGFTLVELLIVISIIAVLVALLFPSIKTALLKAEAASSQTKAQLVVTAITAWNATYGTWPIIGVTTNVAVTKNFIRLLTGQSATSTEAWIANNPKQIKFLDINNKGDLDGNENYVDSVKNVYQVVVDQTYAGQVTNVFAANASYQANICVFTAGADHLWDQRGLASATNADNIVVWK